MVYNNLGQLWAIVDPVGNRTIYQYDVMARKQFEIDPLGDTLTYHHDELGRIDWITDRRDWTREFTFDAISRLTTEEWFDDTDTLINTITTTYDNVGNKLTVGDTASGTYTFTYDAMYRVSSTVDMYNVTRTFQYDEVGNRTQIVDSFGGTTTLVYDEINQVTSRQLDDGTNEVRIDFTYTPNGRYDIVTRYSDLAGTILVGSTVYAYDWVGRTTSINHRDASNAVIADFDWTPDSAGRVETETVDSVTTTFAYDTTNQLTGATGGRSENYTYDSNGNRTLTDYVTGPGNQLLEDAT
jgi:YD repeat-containing protein